MLNKIETDYEPAYLTVAFDLKAPTFRHLEYEDYKAGRKAMPPELVMQMPLLKDVLGAMKIRILELEGYEADDIIARWPERRKARACAADHYRRQRRPAARERENHGFDHQKRHHRF